MNGFVKNGHCANITKKSKYKFVIFIASLI